MTHDCVTALIAELADARQKLEAALARALAAEAALARAREALLRHGAHWGQTLESTKDCRCLMDGPDTCDCGLDAALAATAPAAEQPAAPAEIRKLLVEMVGDSECYCPENTAARGPCPWCRAKAVLCKPAAQAECLTSVDGHHHWTTDGHSLRYCRSCGKPAPERKEEGK